jgi:hypothetical protein
MTVTIIAPRSEVGRGRSGLAWLAGTGKLLDEAFKGPREFLSAQVAPERRGRGKTSFKQSQVKRIVKGVEASGAKGTFEFHLQDEVVKFHMTGESDAVGRPAKVDASSNPWDEVLKNGKAKPALTLLKKVP